MARIARPARAKRDRDSGRHLPEQVVVRRDEDVRQEAVHLLHRRDPGRPQHGRNRNVQSRCRSARHTECRGRTLSTCPFSSVLLQRCVLMLSGWLAGQWKRRALARLASFSSFAPIAYSSSCHRFHQCLEYDGIPGPLRLGLRSGNPPSAPCPSCQRRFRSFPPVCLAQRCMVRPIRASFASPNCDMRRSASLAVSLRPNRKTMRCGARRSCLMIFVPGAWPSGMVIAIPIRPECPENLSPILAAFAQAATRLEI